MTVPARPLVVIAGKINPAGVAQLESEARVVIAPDQETKTVIELARDAEAILFRAGPRCDDIDPRGVPARAGGGAPRRGARHGRSRVGDAARRRRGPRARLQLAGGGRARAHAHARVRQAHGGDRPADAQGRLARPPRGRQHRARRARPSASWGSATSAGGSPGSPARIGMRVLGYDKYVPADEVRRRGAEPVGSLEELLPQVDVLTCHTPLTPETRHMIDERALARLRPGAIFINTSRGPVHSERAVFEALVQKRLGRRGPRRVRAGAEPGRQPDLQPRQRGVLGPRRRGDARGEPRGLPPGDGGDPARAARGAA